MYDKEQQLGGKVKEGLHRAGETAEQDYDRYGTRVFQQLHT